jgi:NADPH-dependent 2,4-dienoyl-CoA reductase/sulfur reductase-like enzyme
MTAPARVVVVGAGPAGIRAAEGLAAAGLVPLVIDEGSRAGGQIYRRPPDGFSRPPSVLYGSEAGKAVALHETFDRLVAEGRVVHRPLHSVLAVADGALQVLGPQGAAWISFDRLVLATGATDRLAPVPGWHGAGVYSLGAMQVALKAQGVALGRRLVLAGSGPLLTLLAVQMLKAGAGIEAVLDTASLARQAAGLPGLMARPVLAARGLAMRARLGRLYHAGVTLERIETDARGPLAVHWRDVRGRSRRSACDAVGLGWHLRAETHVADLAGCAFDYDEAWQQWLPRADAWGRAGGGIYLAGDGFRLHGADSAEVSGRVAAAACLGDLGLPTPDVKGDLARLARLARFARGLSRSFPWPGQHVRALPDHSVVCRCENVTAGALRATVLEGGAEANRAKSLGRVGMGRCQGRYCQLAGAEIIAQTGSLASASKAGRLRAQAPTRPAPVAALVADPPPPVR